MDLSNLELKIEELGIDDAKAGEILEAAKALEQREALPDGIPTANLELMREYEKDWRKKAIISAEIIKRGLDA